MFSRSSNESRSIGGGGSEVVGRLHFDIQTVKLIFHMWHTAAPGSALAQARAHLEQAHKAEAELEAALKKAKVCPMC